IIALLGCCFLGCQHYLDIKPDKSMATPGTLKDLHRLLNNFDAFNSGFPGLGEETSDDVWLTDARWAALDEVERSNYCFNNIETPVGRWHSTYMAVVHSNIVLQGLIEIDEPSSATYQRAHLEGGARFFRAHAYYQLAQVFAKHYNAATAGTELGIVLRRGTAIDEPLARATVAETYDAIITDLQQACQLLPPSVRTTNLPNKAAAYGLLSRTYLTMGQYELAGYYADSALMYHDVLLDYNELDAGSNSPFPRFHEETIHLSRMTSSSVSTSRAAISPVLLASYAPHDLRHALFFRRNTDGTHRFKGSYDGSSGTTLFNGLSAAELYLTKAECLARKGQGEKALELMNRLLIHRWENGYFQPFTVDNTSDVLEFVLHERRKE